MFEPVDSTELYDLFLALAPARISVAQRALELEGDERCRQLDAALVPLAVDAALLGAEGLSELARAIAETPSAPRDELAAALKRLELSVEALGHGDASGARVDEAMLHQKALALRGVPRDDPVARVSHDGSDETHWQPPLADDMVAAFLDECVERTESLAMRLLELERRGADSVLLDEIFRDLHTLKGSSAFAGLKKMNRVAHHAEDLAGELRDGRRSADRTLIDALLAGLDALRAILQRARVGAPIDVDVSAVLTRLKRPDASAEAPLLPLANAAPTPPTTRAAPGQATLRIDFEKIDLLLNLVGEIVLARGRISGAADTFGALLREVEGLKKRLVTRLAASNGEARSADALLVEDLQRTERVLRETHGDLDGGLATLGLAAGQLRDTVMKLRMVPIARLFGKYQRTVRELCHELEKEVHVELIGADTELDKVLVERLEDPILHLVRNAVDHGIETPEVREAAGKPRAGSLVLSAEQRGGQVIVSLRDDGSGIDVARVKAKALSQGLITAAEADAMSDVEACDIIFRPGFSTADEVSHVSGRGVGMDVVRDAISRLKGTIALVSTPSLGTTFELRLPLTLAITQVLVARVGSEVVAIPLDAVQSAQAIAPGQLEAVSSGVCLRLGAELVPVVDLAQLLGLEDTSLTELGDAAVVVVALGSERMGLHVRQVLGRHEVVVKSLGPLLAAAPCAAGATLVGDRVLLVVDLAAIAARARQPAVSGVLRSQTRPRSEGRAAVLVAEDSEVMRESIRRELSQAGYEVVTAVDGTEALRLAREQRFDAVSTDVMMPGLDGYELTRALRADPRYRRTPILMVTSKDARIDALRGYDAGADAYLGKPTDSGELLRTLQSLLAKKR